MGKYLVVIAVAGLSFGCDSFLSSSEALPMIDRQSNEQKLARVTDPTIIVAGASLYQQHCASCHGANAEGDSDWRKRDVDGAFPPPPLNGSGHAWHHSRGWLVQTISDGTEPEGNMPSWSDKLSQKQMASIVSWLQAQWPDKVYDTWVEKQLMYLK